MIMTNEDFIYNYVSTIKCHKDIESTNQNLRYKDGILFSYNTAIAELMNDNITLIINKTKYSTTTSRHQNLLNKALRFKNYHIVYVDNIDRGTQSLKNYYEEYNSSID